MPTAGLGDVDLYYEETGAGTPLVWSRRRATSRGASFTISIATAYGCGGMSSGRTRVGVWDVSKTVGRRSGPEVSRRHAHLILTVALTLSSVGDVFLAVDRRRYFGHALTVFLLAHLTYVLLFVRSWPRPLRPSARQVILAARVLVYSLLLTSWLASGLGRHTVPVLIYACAITGMAVSAIIAGFSRPFVWIGAILFLIADSLIAVARFKTGWTPAAYLIWPTYYLGQYGITVGFLREQARDGGIRAEGASPPV